MDEGDFPIRGCMRVCVGNARLAMCCPAGMADRLNSIVGALTVNLRTQLGQFSDRADDCGFGPVGRSECDSS